MPLFVTPDDGDIVVAQLNGTNVPEYAWYTAPGPDEAVFKSREHALDDALFAARVRAVRVWLNDGGYTFELIGDFRHLDLGYCHGAADAPTASG